MNIFEAIFGRRSIRRFIDKPIEEEKIAKIIDAARWAPSIGNLQGWEFIVIRDSRKKIQLAEASFNQHWISTASVIIVVLTKNERILRTYGKKGSIYVKYNTGAAIQNMLLAIHSLGLGGCWVGVFDEEAVRRILKIPPEIEIHGLIPIGYPSESPAPPYRLGIEQITFFEEYGNRLKKF